MFFYLPYMFQGLAFADYFIKQDYYAKVLCVNKEKPRLKCNGKCQIKNFINDDKEESNKPAVPSTFFKYEALIVTSLLKNEFLGLVFSFTPNVLYQKHFPKDEFTDKLWQPPENEFNPA
jgi:hypothetical protein